MKKISAWILAAVLLLIACPAAAAQTIAVDMDCSLTLNLHDDADQPISDLSVFLYKVADLDAQGNMTLTESFAEYDVSLDASDRADAAQALADYIQRDAVEADVERKTDADGQLILSPLHTGVYLILTDTLSDGETLLRAQPLLLDLPMIDERSGVYAYDVTASPKPLRTVIEKTSIRVIVKWEDKGQESKRPGSVTVDLFRDGELYDTRTVDAESSWTYTWERIDDDGLDGTSARYDAPAAQGKDRPLSGEHTWHVVEHGADGYTVSYDVTPSENTLVIINTLPAPEPEPTLPQTGQLWWPVAVLAFCGAVLTLIGVIRSRRSRGE